MDRRTIIIGIAVLALIIIVWYFMFRKRDESETIPTIIPGDVVQTQYPVNEPKIETYIVEYADPSPSATDNISDVNLSKKINFEVKWENGHGFNNVKGMKLEHRLKSSADDTNSVLIESVDLPIDSFGVNKIQNLTKKLEGTNRTKSIVGINYFEILYTTQPSGTSPDRVWKTLNTSGKSFSPITITRKDLLVALELVDIATYTFTPVLSTINSITFTNLVQGNFISLKNSAGIFLNGFLGKATEGIYFIKGVESNSVQMTIGDGSIKKLIQINDDGSIGTAPIPDSLSIDHDVKLIQNTIDGTKYYSILKTSGIADTFMVYSGGKFVFKDIKLIDDTDEYNTIFLNFSEDSSTIGFYCKESVSCITNKSQATCNGTTIGRGNKCISYSIGKPSGTSGDGYKLCTTQQKTNIPSGSNTPGEFSETCPAPCIWELNSTFTRSCPPSNYCKMPGDPNESVKEYNNTTYPALHGGGCDPKPTNLTSTCNYTGNCGECLYSETKERCATTNDELTKHGRAKYVRYTKLTPETAGKRCIIPSSDKPSAWLPANASECATDRAQCSISSTVSKCDPNTKDGLYDRTTYTVSNPHNRPANNSNCTAPWPNPSDVYNPKCRKGSCRGLYNNIWYNACTANGVTEDYCKTGKAPFTYNGKSYELDRATSCVWNAY